MATQAPRLRQRSGLVDPPGRAGPHLAVYVVPLKDGKLNAKHFTGGKKVLSQLQTDFAKDVGQRHGLERGIEGSQAKHQTIKEFYAQVNQPIKEVQLSAQSVEPRVIEKAGLMDKMRGRGDLVESNKGVADRLTEAVQQAYAPVIEKAKQGDLQARRAAEMARQPKPLPATKTAGTGPCRAIRSGLKC